MFNNAILASLAASLFLSTGYGSPLITEKVDTDVISVTTTENPAVSFGTFTDRGCTGGQQVWSNPDDGCHGLPGQGMQVWWIANTCRIFIYKGGDCSASSGEIQVFPGQCHDIAQYHSIKAFCH